MYKFFVQPQVDETDHSIYGYEVLLRKRQKDTWTLPTNFSEISLDDQAKLLEQTAAALKTSLTNKVIAFNLNHDQIENPLTLGVIVALKKRINPSALTIELTDAPTLEEVQRYSILLHQNGMQLVLDDVGTGTNTYENIKDALPYVDQIKFAMQNLRMSGEANQIPELLAFWTKIARNYRLDMVLEGVEDQHDQALAAKFGIKIHQGYLYGKPMPA
ncbi:EAL domain-containing protein [Lactiplantibacillus sp. WILCCON 0030]|uniref:EAL domain-containing protein n=1 Tax=Lactiplantibacillus brownii TaxID=3069269 RepID=A0ABU1AC73_9LACO|nr:EAL domain-containing protein [Lactiplantibacillus brownii]MDQ7938547.1 EAL domain-containing protein [Lactiplantibacillus brownii]